MGDAGAVVEAAGALAELASAAGAAAEASVAAFAARAASINSRCFGLTQSSTMHCAFFTFSSIYLLEICTIKVSPRTSSRRIAPVEDSTGFIT